MFYIIKMVLGKYAYGYGFALPNPVSIHRGYLRLRSKIGWCVQTLQIKNEDTWCVILGSELNTPNKIQSREYSRDGVMGDIAHNGSVWQNPNDNRNCPYLNRDGSKRNLNLNWIDNRWNGRCRFAAVRKSFHFSSNFY